MYYFNNDGVYSLLATPFEIKSTSVRMTYNSEQPKLPDQLKWCTFAFTQNTFYAANCLDTTFNQIDSYVYFWIPGMAEWIQIGQNWTAEERNIMGSQFGGSGAIINECVMVFAGGVDSVSKLDDVGSGKSIIS